MPTASERARQEALDWAALSARLSKGSNPTEREVMLYTDPTSDLLRRSREWSHEVKHFDLASISRFASALAMTESEAWDSGELDVATKAYEARRHLLGDRLVHWAVPYLLAAGDHQAANFILDLGDEMRLAPALPGAEGLLLDGEDSFGPLRNTGSIWSGWVEVEHGERPEDVALFWREIATWHEGTAQLWTDLAARACRDDPGDKFGTGWLGG